MRELIMGHCKHVEWLNSTVLYKVFYMICTRPIESEKRSVKEKCFERRYRDSAKANNWQLSEHPVYEGIPKRKYWSIF